MAKKKTKRKKARSEAKGVKDLVKKEYTDEEKARLAKHQDRKKRKPVKFKTVKSDSDNPTIALQDPDEPLLAVTISEALGTVDFDMQVHCQDSYKQELRCYLILGFWGWPANGCSKRSSLSDIVNHVNGKCQVVLIKTKTANRTSTSTAALSILISCVLDSMYFQTNIQIDAIRHIRKM